MNSFLKATEDMFLNPVIKSFIFMLRIIYLLNVFNIHFTPKNSDTTCD